MTVRVTVWNEFRQERSDEPVRRSTRTGSTPPSPTGLRDAGLEVRTATLDEPEHGLTDAVLAETDVLTWWGHVAHDEVDDAVVDRVQARVLDGMGLIVLHSGHFSKIFRRLMGTTCDLKWREAGERERLWVVDPGHPIAAGLGEWFEIEHEEMYGEHFDIPAPDGSCSSAGSRAARCSAAAAATSAAGAASSTSGPATRPTRPTHEPNVRRVIANAARWAAEPAGAAPTFGNREPLEPLLT